MVRRVEPRILIGFKVILVDINVKFLNASADINDWYFYLFMELVLALIDDMSYWGIGKSNLNLKNIYIFNIKYIFLYLQRLFFSQIKNYSLITRLAKYWSIWLPDLLI